MASLSNDSVAEVLAEISNILMDPENDMSGTAALAALNIRSSIHKFLDDHSRTLQDLYDQKLNV